MSFRSGKQGTITLGGTMSGDGTVYKIKRWSVDLPASLLDVTHGNDAGFGEYVAGVSDMDFTFELDHDVGTSPFATDLVVGTILTRALLYVDIIGANFWQICTPIIQDVKESLDVRGLASIHVTAKATGGSYYFTEFGDVAPC